MEWWLVTSMLLRACLAKRRGDRWLELLVLDCSLWEQLRYFAPTYGTMGVKCALWEFDSLLRFLFP